MADLNQEVDTSGQQVSGQTDTIITAVTSEILQPDQIIQRAIEKKVIYPPLFDDLQTALNTAKEVSQAMSFPTKTGTLEEQGANMMILLDQAYAEKERQLMPDRNLEQQYEDIDINHPQSVVNTLTTGDAICFTQDGNPATLETYFREYYRDLIDSGLSISIATQNSREWEKQGNPQSEQNATIGVLAQADIPLTVLILEQNGETKRIPILFSYSRLKDSGAAAMYTYGRSKGKIFNEAILVNPTDAKRRGSTMVDSLASIVHEVDHAVFNLLHPSEFKAVYKDNARDEDKFQAEKSAFTDEVGWGTIFEGLARKAQHSFQRIQAEGLTKYSRAGNGIQDGVRLLELANKAQHEHSLQALLYSSGEVITEVFSDQYDLKTLYTSNIVEEMIVKQPDTLLTVMRYFITHEQGITTALNKISEYQTPQREQRAVRAHVRQAFDSFAIPFILGNEYFTLLEQINAEVDAMDEETVKKKVEEIRAESEDVYKMLKERTDDNRDLIPLWEVIRGKIKKRFNEKFETLFTN